MNAPVALCLRVSRVLGRVVVLTALTVVVGWIWEIPWLRNPFPGTVDMKFNTALAFVMLGSALVLASWEGGGAWHRRGAKTLSAAVAVFGGWTLIEYVFRFDSGLSQLFIQETKGALLTVHLGRPAPITAMNFLLLGGALAQRHLDRWWGRPLPLVAGAGSLLALFGYIYQTPHFYTVVSSATGIAVTTTVLFLVLTIGVLAAFPEHPLTAAIANPGTGGILARRLLPTAIFLPLVMESASHFGVEANLYQASDEAMLHALLVATALVYIGLRTARILTRVDDTRHRAEESLSKERNFIRTAIDAQPGIFYLITPDGHFKLWNHNMEVVSGYSAEELSDKRALDLIRAEDRDSVARAIGQVFTKGSADVEAGLLAKDGRSMDYFLTGERLVDDDGTMLVGMGIDISARRRMETDLRSAKAQAEDAYRDLKNTQDSLMQAEKMAALGGLVAGVAHEINTPVGIALSSASHLALETEKVARAYADGALEQTDFEDYLGTASEASRLLVSSCDRAAELIRSFKQVAVDQTGGERRSFQLKEYIGEILLSLKPRLKKTPHTISVDCASDLILDTNPGLLSQSLTNLVMNSLVHAFDEGVAGRISITVSALDPDMVEILYADNGRGIPQDIQGKVFDPFFTTRRGDGGSGLGLHIVYNAICSGLKGSISLDSAPETGTAFTLRIPRVLPSV